MLAFYSETVGYVKYKLILSPRCQEFSTGILMSPVLKALSPKKSRKVQDFTSAKSPTLLKTDYPSLRLAEGLVGAVSVEQPKIGVRP